MDLSFKRFWDKVDIRCADQCWNWRAYKNTRGYGTFSMGRARRGLLAPRIAYELINGPIAIGLCVRHRCDNPSCCNPNHLIIGTKKQNSGDMVDRGRSNKGERHGLSKLTAHDVIQIRTRYFGGEKATILSDEYGIHQNTIYKLVSGTRWRHLG